MGWQIDKMQWQHIPSVSDAFFVDFSNRECFFGVSHYVAPVYDMYLFDLFLHPSIRARQPGTEDVTLNQRDEQNAHRRRMMETEYPARDFLFFSRQN